MIDDLTKGVDEPQDVYVEGQYRLVLRRTTDIRLGEIGYRTGLLNEKCTKVYNKKSLYPMTLQAREHQDHAEPRVNK
jgi:tRNA U34 5-carboxymethylaminomethyl modifying enzyme MnmG/GidA